MSAANPRPERPGPVMRMIIRLLPKITPAHVWLYRALGGRIVGRNPLGPPVLLVTTIGRRSGQPRTVTLAHLRIGDDVIVIGSNGGNPKLPAWAHNLRAHPRAEVQLGQKRYPVIAEFLEGEEWQHHCFAELVHPLTHEEDVGDVGLDPFDLGRPRPPGRALCERTGEVVGGWVGGNLCIHGNYRQAVAQPRT